MEIVHREYPIAAGRDGGEVGLNNVQVYVDSDDSGTYDVGEPTAQTSATGGYTIDNLTLGQHTIRAITPAGLRPTNSAQIVNLTAQQTFATNVNFGFVNPRIAGAVFNDANDNKPPPSVTGSNTYFSQASNSKKKQEKSSTFLPSWFSEEKEEKPKTPDVFADNPFVKAFQDMMQAGATGAQKPAPDNPALAQFSQVMNSMFDTGLEMQKEYQKNVEALFDAYKAGPGTKS